MNVGTVGGLAVNVGGRSPAVGRLEEIVEAGCDRFDSSWLV